MSQFVGSKTNWRISKDGGYKNSKHAKFSNKPTFLSSWYAHVGGIKDEDMFVFREFAVLYSLLTTS